MSKEADLDTFADTTPIEISQVTEPVAPENPEDDTFDNAYYPDKETKDSQVENLDDQTDELDASKVEKKAEEKVEEKAKEKVEEKVEPKTEEKVEAKTEKKAEPKTEVKMIKLKSGDSVTDIPEDATVKVKINGKNEFVSLSDLKSDYSGQKAWTEKIATANEKTEAAEAQTTKFQAEKTEIVGHLEKIAAMLDDEKGDPMAAMNYLLDMTGRDVNIYNKRFMANMEERLAELSGMDEVEKELYWNKQELSSLKSNHAAKADLQKNSETQRDAISKVNQLRESHDVTEQQYVQAEQELTDAGFKDLKPEHIVRHSVMTPFVNKAIDLTVSHEETLGDDDMDALVQEVAVTLRKYPKLSEQDVVKDSAKRLGINIRSQEDDDIDAINDKIGKTKIVKNDPNLRHGGALEEGELDMFDD